MFIVPPMVYTEKVFMGAVSGSFFDFWPSMFANVLADGVYPQGNLSWHHFWFIAYLYLFCLLGIPVFGWLESASGSSSTADLNGRSGRTRLEKIAVRFHGVRLYMLIPVLLLPEVMLRWIFPGFQDLIHDWANFLLWFIIFVAGFVIASHESLLGSAEKLRIYSLVGALSATGVLYLVFGSPSPELNSDDPGVLWQYLLWCVLRISMIWCCILACLGYAGRYLRFNNRFLGYVNQAVYPLFILHLTVITVLGYFIVQTDWPLWSKYLFITTATFVLVLFVYHLLIRPFNFARLLFGVKPE